LALGACATSAPRPARDRAPGTAAPDVRKPRVIVTTDPELDDSNSLVRYLLYSTDVRTEGLVYASSQYHWKGDGTRREGTWSLRVAASPIVKRGSTARAEPANGSEGLAGVPCVAAT
jgi:hypothetical protein